MIVIEPTSPDAGMPAVRTIQVSQIKPGMLVTNIGIVDNVTHIGVFYVLRLHGTHWSLANGRGDIEQRDVTWHESQAVTIDLVR
jgi:hypothetical protein